MRTKFRRSAFALAVLALSGCSYHVDKTAPEPSTDFSQRSLGYADVQSTFTNKCASCHTHNHAWAASYNGIRNNIDEIPARIQSADPSFMMPPPGATPLSRNEKAAILAWISRGAPQVGGQPANPGNPGNPPGQPVPPSLSFAYVKQQVLGPKCFSCHHHADDFDTFDHTRPLIREMASRIHAFGTDNQMPPPNKPQLSAEELKLLDDWIQAGAPENGPAIEPGPAPQPQPQPQPSPEPQPQPLPQPGPRVAFATVKAQVLDVKCATCHHHEKSGDFTTFEKTKPLLAEMKSRIHAFGTDNQMPPPSKPQLTAAELKLLDSWLDDGAPESIEPPFSQE